MLDSSAGPAVLFKETELDAFAYALTAPGVRGS